MDKVPFLKRKSVRIARTIFECVGILVSLSGMILGIWRWYDTNYFRGNVEGTVLNSRTKNPVVGARVIIGNRMDSTESNGNFRISRLKPDDYRLVLIKDKCETIEDRVEIEKREMNYSPKTGQCNKVIFDLP